MKEEKSELEEGGNRDTEHEASNKSTVQRRTVLSLIAASGYFGVQGSVRATPPAHVEATVAKRSFDNPFTQSEIRGLQAEKLETFADRAGVSIDGRLQSVLDDSSGKLVAYAAGVTPDGVLRQSFGIAEQPEDVGTAQKAATAEMEEFNAEMSSRETSGEQVTTQSNNWDTLEDSKMTTYSEAGNLIDYYKWLQNADDYDYFAYKDRFAMEPGTYTNYEGSVHMDWTDSNPEMSLEDWEPFNGTDGSVTQQLTLSSSGFSYTYGYSTGETTVVDDTTESEGVVDWTIDFNTRNAKQTTSGFEPSTMGKVVEGNVDQAVYSVKSNATFRDDATMFYEVSNNRSFLPY